MAELILGPLLRYVSETEATVWVETDAALRGRDPRPPRADLRRSRATTTRWSGSRASSRAAFYEYEVALDGEERWPLPDSDLPPSAIRTLGRDKPLDICFGSCRVALPARARPTPTSKDTHEDGRRVDALRVLASEMSATSATSGPSCSSCSATRSTSTRARRGRASKDPRAPRHRRAARRGGHRLRGVHLALPGVLERPADPLAVLDRLGLDGLGRPRHERRLEHLPLLARGDAAASPGGTGARSAGIVSYWIYQHLGNLSPARARRERDLREGPGQPRDATEALREWASEIDSTGAGTRWSFCRDFGGTRAIFIDSRAGRVLEQDRRSMVDDEEWDWIVEHATGDFDHLLIATTIPCLLSPGFHHLEAWNERVCDGAWGGAGRDARREAAPGGRLRPLGLLRQSPSSACASLLDEVGTGKRGKPPASIVVLSGDVHHAYLAEVGFRPGTGMQSAGLPGGLLALPQPARRARARRDQGGFTRPFTALTRALARRRRAPPIPGSAGACSRAPTSTTRWRRCASTAARP